MKSKLVYVIATPSLNQGQFISKTIESIWSQKGDFYIKHIISDGGSTDNTVSILKDFQLRLMNKSYPIQCSGISFSWSSHKDAGQASAISNVFLNTSGDVYTWLNSDDYYASENTLSYIDNVKKKYNPDIIVGSANYVNENCKVIEKHYINKIVSKSGFISKPILKLIESFDLIAQPSAFIDKIQIKQYPLDRDFFYCMDWDLWIRCYRGGATFYKVNKALSCMRRHSNAKTNSFGLRFYREKNLLYKKHKIINANSIYSKIKKVQLSSNSLFIQRLLSFILNWLLTVKRFIFGRNTIIG